MPAVAGAVLDGAERRIPFVVVVVVVVAEALIGFRLLPRVRSDQPKRLPLAWVAEAGPRSVQITQAEITGRMGPRVLSARFWQTTQVAKRDLAAGPAWEQRVLVELALTLRAVTVAMAAQATLVDQWAQDRRVMAAVVEQVVAESTRLTVRKTVG